MEQGYISVMHVASDDTPCTNVLQVKALGRLWPVEFASVKQKYFVCIEHDLFSAGTVTELQETINDAGLNK